MPCREHLRRAGARRLAALAVAALCSLSAAEALADPVPGAAYAGLTDHGEPIELVVAGDGARVVSYRISNVQGDTCVFTAQGNAGEWEGAAVAGGVFQYTLYDAVLLQGTFPGAQTASGTFRLFNHAVPGVKPACDTGTVGWTATTASTPPPPPPGTQPAPPAPPAQTPTTPKPTPKPTTPKRAAKKRYGSSVTLRKRDRAHLVGRIASASRSCRSQRKVVLRRGTRTIRSTMSKSDGSYRFARSAGTRRHEVRAVIATRTGTTTICGAASSKRVRG